MSNLHGFRRYVEQETAPTFQQGMEDEYGVSADTFWKYFTQNPITLRNVKTADGVFHSDLSVLVVPDSWDEENVVVKVNQVTNPAAGGNKPTAMGADGQAMQIPDRDYMSDRDKPLTFPMKIADFKKQAGQKGGDNQRPSWNSTHGRSWAPAAQQQQPGGMGGMPPM